MNGASAIASDVRTGKRSAVEMIREALDRAGATASLNAFTTLDHEGAIAAAEGIDATVAAGNDPGPLAGVPVAIKDLIDQAGRPTTCGSSFYRNTPTHSATVVGRLEAAGAVIIGRAGLHEFAYGFSSENDWFGPVRNPLDAATSPGGSSGGSAAAVAGGVVPIGVGTDTGGSVRVPAAMCGLVGLKVTHGRVPLTGVFPLAASVDTVGPITRSVADAALAYGVMAGHDPLDPWSSDRPVDRLAPRHDLRGVVVGIPHPMVDRPLETEIERGFAHALAVIADAGAEIRQVDIPDLHVDTMPVGVWGEAADVHRSWFEADPDAYGPEVRLRLETGMAITDDDRRQALEWRARLRVTLAEVFTTVDLLVTPTTAARIKHIGDPLVDGGEGPEPYRRALSWFTTLFNQGGGPALSLPVPGFGSPPASLQVVAAPWDEARLLAAGLVVEDRLSLNVPRT